VTAASRDLIGETLVKIEFSAPVGGNDYGDCLRLAAQWCDKNAPDSVALNGFRWQEDGDCMVLYLIATIS
jgi:hypothetical protein